MNDWKSKTSDPSDDIKRVRQQDRMIGQEDDLHSAEVISPRPSMSEKPVPPFRRRPTLVEKIVKNSIFGKFGSASPFQPEHQPEKDNPMNQKPTPVFTPGDRLHISQPFAALPTEVVFLGFDPEQKHLAMIRDASSKNAPILLIHYANLRIPPKKPVEHVAEVFLYAYGTSVRIKDFREFPSMHHLNDSISGTRTLKAIDAMVTEDGTVVLKYIETEPEEDAIRAAYEKPVTGFIGAESVTYIR